MQFENVTSCIEFIETSKRFRPKTDLENMKKLCKLFSNPEKDLKFIHITGTNGKGSTSLFITNLGASNCSLSIISLTIGICLS